VAKRGLLSRLDDSHGGSRAPDVTESIIEHLKVLLNARQGGSATVPRYGLVDFNEVVHHFPTAIQRLQQEIRATVLEYEPRVKNVTVRHLPTEDPLTLQFEITAQPSEKGARGTLKFRTQMSAGGKLDVW
jgi:type VI secretion system protein